MDCSCLQITSVSTSGLARINGKVSIGASLWNPGGDCPRSGTVTFTWNGLSTGSPAPSVIGAIPVWTPTGGDGYFVYPGDTAAEADMTWVPTTAVVGNVGGVGGPLAAVGFVSAAVDVAPCACGNGQCPEIPPSANLLDTIVDSANRFGIAAEGAGT